MTTVTEQLRWDAFLRERVDALPEARRDAAAKALRRNIDRFREVDWPNVLREYNNRRDCPYKLPDSLEPHWVEAGKAVYWAQDSFIGKRAEHAEEQPWQPTSPLPANNAQQLVHYLGKGFRLRPPSGVDAASQPAVPPEGIHPHPEPPAPQFWCRRHKDKGDLGFATWKLYLRHCEASREMPDASQVPASVAEAMGRYEWYCVLHNVGFNHRRAAEQHARGEQRKPGPSQHPGLEQMRVARTGAAA